MSTQINNYSFSKCMIAAVMIPPVFTSPLNVIINIFGNRLPVRVTLTPQPTLHLDHPAPATLLNHI